MEKKKSNIEQPLGRSDSEPTHEQIKKEYKDFKKELDRKAKKGIPSTFAERNKMKIMQKKLRKFASK